MPATPALTPIERGILEVLIEADEPVGLPADKIAKRARAQEPATGAALRALKRRDVPLVEDVVDTTLDLGVWRATPAAATAL